MVFGVAWGYLVRNGVFGVGVFGRGCLVGMFGMGVWYGVLGVGMFGVWCWDVWYGLFGMECLAYTHVSEIHL